MGLLLKAQEQGKAGFPGQLATLILFLGPTCSCLTAQSQSLDTWLKCTFLQLQMRHAKKCSLASATSGQVHKVMDQGLQGVGERQGGAEWGEWNWEVTGQGERIAP